MNEVSISDIVIGKRTRRDAGDVNDLCRSIEEVGLLHPVVLAKGNRLVAGLRRLEAFKQLKRKTIPAIVAKDLDDARLLLVAERDENDCRLDFTTLEAVAMGLALEELERPKAKDRMAHGKTAPGKNASEKFTEASTREKVGQAIGMSGPTYQRAKAVAKAAQDDPDTFGPIAEEMDRTGKVLPAFNAVQRIKNNGRLPRKRTKPPSRFDDDACFPLCEQLNNWLAKRFDKAGGAEARDECAKLLAQLQRRIEQWQKQKPL